jgi:hypothetical protein
MPVAAGSNVFQGAIVAKNLSDFFGIGSAAPGVTTGPQLIRVVSDPNGSISATIGSVAMSQEPGAAIYQNTDGIMAWAKVFP